MLLEVTCQCTLPNGSGFDLGWIGFFGFSRVVSTRTQFVRNKVVSHFAGMLEKRQDTIPALQVKSNIGKFLVKTMNVTSRV